MDDTQRDETQGQRGTEGRGSDGARVLVIDDEPEIRRAVRAGLAGAGFAVEWAPTAAEGLDLVTRWHPDVVILDLSLPDMDGLEACRQLRAWSPVPIIVLSVRAGDAGGVACFHAGVLTIDCGRRVVTMDAAEVHLTPTEYEVLKYLAQHAGKVITHRTLLRAVWGPAYEDEAHYLLVFIGQLRRKIEPDPARPTYLLTEPGIGYRLRSPE